MKKLLVLLLVLILPIQAFGLANWDQSTFVYGAGLDEGEINTVADLLQIKDMDAVLSQPILGQDLMNYVGASQPDSYMISSALVTKKNDGSGISVEIMTPDNITLIAKEQYIGAAITAGVDDVDILIAAPYPVTGESALAGVYKAFEVNGEDLSKDAMKLAQEELELVGDITEDSQASEDFDDAKLSQAITEMKEEIIKVIEDQGQISREEIEKIVREILDKMDLTGVINQVHIENLINFFINFSKTSDLDFGKMKTQLENLSKELAPKLKEILKDAEESGLLDKIIAFFKDLFSRFSRFFD